MGKIENAVAMAENIAMDDSHGYDQIDRMGPVNYDCSGLIISCCEKCGIPVKTNGASYTGNMKSIFLKTGFQDVVQSVNLANGEGLKRGDVLLGNGHTAFYCGNGKIVHASINELGKVTGGRSGDQNGKEICIRCYYNKPWISVLRYLENNISTGEDSGKSAGTSASTSAGYTQGNTYKLNARLNVRKSPGTTGQKKVHGELTADGQKHDSTKTGCLDKGTCVICKEVKKIGNDIWIRTPSGWLAAYYQGKNYIS